MRDIAPDRWLSELADLAASGFAYLDLLTAVDRSTTLEVVARVVDPTTMTSALLRTSVRADDPAIDSVVSVFPAASWHEREAAEMFGIRFVGHPDPRPLLSDGGQPPLLRKSTPLAARVDTPWPGVDASSRRRARVPGVNEAWVESS